MTGASFGALRNVTGVIPANPGMFHTVCVWNLLAIDDDPRLLRSVQRGLQSSGFDCTTASGLDQASELIEKTEGFDLILLDITLPKGSGWAFLEKLRSERNETPVIFLTARDALEDRVRGLRLGADDYVTKPFELEELVARIEAVLRRHEPPICYTLGDIRVDLKNRSVHRDGREIELSKREFDLLIALIEAEGEVLDRQQLLQRVWDIRHDPGTNMVDVVVMRIRKKLDHRGQHTIQTVVGKGYRVEAKRVRP